MHISCWIVHLNFLALICSGDKDLAKNLAAYQTTNVFVTAADSLLIHWLHIVGAEAVVFLPVSQTVASGRDRDFGSFKFTKQFQHQGYIVELFSLMWLQRPMAEQSIVRQLELCPNTGAHSYTHARANAHTHCFHQLSLKLLCSINPNLVKGVFFFFTLLKGNVGHISFIILFCLF